VVLNLFCPWAILKYPMGHFAVQTRHEQLVGSVLHVGQ